MGLTQHRNAVATIREIVNLAAAARQHRAAGRRGVPGARPQQRAGRPHDGDLREAAAAFLDALGAEFGFEPPRAHGFDTVETIQAMADGGRQGVRRHGRQLRVGHARHAVPARRWRCRLTVQVATKLNRSHVVTGEQALILPLGRTERHEAAA